MRATITETPPEEQFPTPHFTRSRSACERKFVATQFPRGGLVHCLLCLMKHSRHTFASDMVRAGVSLPALMQLMGHAQIQTTIVYMQVTPLEVYQQYARAVAQLIRPVPVTPA